MRFDFSPAVRVIKKDFITFQFYTKFVLINLTNLRLWLDDDMESGSPRVDSLFSC